MTYYIKYNDTNDTTGAFIDGTLEYPFYTLNQAVTTLGPGTFELLLLGDSFFLNTSLTFPNSSNYSIRPASLALDQTYYPFYINKSVYMSVKLASLSIQQIQLIDLDTARATGSPTLRVWQEAVLSLDRVKFANVNYTTSYNHFVYTDGTAGKAHLSITNCEFRNLTNVRMQMSATRVTVVNTTFSNLTQSRTTLMYIFNNYSPDYDVTYTNVTVKKSDFPSVPSGSSYGFGYITKAAPNVLFQDFVVKNVTIANKVSFFTFSATTTGLTIYPVLKVKNFIIENMIEVPVEGLTSQLALFQQIQGIISLDFTNFTVTNLQQQYSTFIQCIQPDAPQFAANASFNQITIQNSTNTFISMKYYINIYLDNVQLYHNSYVSPNSAGAMFTISEAGSFVMSNVQGYNNSGPLIRNVNIFNQTIQNFNLVKLYTSTTWSSRYPIYMARVRSSNSYPQWESQQDQSVILMDNIVINGYYSINDLNSTQDEAGTYSIAIVSEYGKAYLQNSYWFNMKLSNFGAGYTNHLQITNLTVDSDFSIAPETQPIHAIFKFGEIRELSITDSRFLNQQNVVILILYFLHRSNNYERVLQPNLLFENLTVVNNTVPMADLNTAYSSLFNIRTPLYPVVAAFKNSYFQGNTILTAVILTDESLKIDVDFIGNTFLDNYAILEGGAISARSMKGEVSQINIINNTFGNNTSLKNGGVIFFLSTQHNITSANNVYYNNSAQGSGGVGYFSHADLSYTETNGTYFNNSASNYGGAWFLNIHRKQADQPLVNFIGTKFEASTALRKGGAIYIETGDVYLEDTSITGSWAKEAGGDAYLIASASIAMKRVNSTRSCSPQGSFLYAEGTISETIVLQNIRVTDVPTSVADKTVLVMNSGSLKVSDSVFKNISSSLFQMTSGSATFLSTSMLDIQCQTTSTAFCIFGGSGTTFSMDGVSISDVTSNQDLILMKTSNRVAIKNSNISNVENVGKKKEYFALVSKKVANVTIQNSNFTQLEFSTIKGQNSALYIAKSIFSNAITQRVLAEASSSSNSQEARFIALYSSNSSITDSDFIANSANASSLVGGAVQIAGSSGNHYIANCSFENNTGMNGGAISIEGTISSLSIERSKFINNTASQNGGSIFLTGQGSDITPVISQTTFQGNQATSGGAVYVSSSPMSIQYSVFNRNTAQNGAAILSLGQSSQRIYIAGTTFTENSAEVGAALMAFGYLNFDTESTTFVNNTAEYGEDIASGPHHLRIKVYQVSETFLFLNDISSEYIKSHCQTVLVYDSQNTSLQNPLIMKPGRTPNYLFEFEVLSQLNQNVTLKSMDLTLGTAATSDSSESLTISTDTFASSSLFGTLESTFNESRGFVFNAFYIRGNFDDTLTLSAQMNAQDSFSNETYDLPVLLLPVTVGSCSIGDIYDSTNLLCNPCSEGSFSLEDPFIVQTCEKCPSTATCLGGNIIYPKPGYWRMDATSDNFLMCSNTDACLGGEGDEGKNISLTGLCGVGHEGVGCGTCSLGYVKTGLNNACTSCSGEIALHIRYVAFLFIRMGLILFTVGLYINSNYRNPKEKAVGILQMSVIKVVVDFMHVISPVVALHTDWPSEVREFLGIISSPTSMNRNNFSLDCLVSSLRGTNEDLLFIKNVILLLQPAIFVLLASIVGFCIYRITGRKMRDLMINIITVAVITGYICQPDILQSIFQLFRCENFGSSQSQQYFLIEDTSVECWQTHHLIWILGLAIPSLILWLVLPVGILVLLLLRRERIKNEDFHRKYDLILEKYQSNKFYWELIILSRKLILILASMLSSVPYMQTYCGFATLIVAYLFHKKFEPYSDLKINKAESISIVSSAAIMYTGLYFVQIRYGETLASISPWLFAVVIVCGVIFFSYCVFLVRASIKQKLKRWTKIALKSLNINVEWKKTNKIPNQTRKIVILKSLQSQDTQTLPPLLSPSKHMRFNSMSLAPPETDTSPSPSRLRRTSTKIPDFQTDVPLKTEPPLTAMTAGDEIDKLFTPRNHSMIFETERDYQLIVKRTDENLLRSPRQSSPAPGERQLLSFKSLETLFLEIDEEFPDDEDAVVVPKPKRPQNKIGKSEMTDDKIPARPNYPRKSSRFSARTERPTLK